MGGSLSVCGRRESWSQLEGACEQVGEAFSRCSPEWVNKGASGAPVLTRGHSAKSGICVTRDHTVTHSKGGVNDSLRAQEKDEGRGQEKPGRGWRKEEGYRRTPFH